MFYTWKAGDTFPALAQRFYGDPSRLATLKRLNEGRSEVQPGERVLVPIFDLDAVQTPAAPNAVALNAVTSKTSPAATTNASAPKAEPAASKPPTPTGARTHVVKDGEACGRSRQELGSGARWNESTGESGCAAESEALHTGQKLRVP
jgi:nucleoid-associated protein YgaU